MTEVKIITNDRPVTPPVILQSRNNKVAGFPEQVATSLQKHSSNRKLGELRFGLKAAFVSLHQPNTCLVLPEMEFDHFCIGQLTKIREKKNLALIIGRNSFRNWLKAVNSNQIPNKKDFYKNDTSQQILVLCLDVYLICIYNYFEYHFLSI